MQGRPLNSKLRIALVIWAVAYPVIACGPAAITEGGITGAIANFWSFAVGGLLFLPWLIGLVVLGAATWLTGSRRGDRDRY
jgi:hypothetical protein